MNNNILKPSKLIVLGIFTLCFFTYTIGQNISEGITFPATNSLSNLAIIDFESSNPLTLSCSNQIDASTGDDCFSQGEIPDGITFTASTGKLAVLGSKIGTSTSLSCTNFNANLIIELTDPANYIEFDVQEILRSGSILINVFDEADNFEFSKSINVTTEQQLLQIQAICSIGRVELLDETNKVALSIDNIRFGMNIIDEEAPVAICPANMIVNAEGGACDAIVSFELSATDNCGEVTLTPSLSSGSTLSVGITTVSLEATDAAGNQGSCDFTVTVKDVEAPQPICKSMNVSFDGEDQLPVSIDDLFDSAASMDNCGTVNLVSPIADQIIYCDEVGQTVDIIVSVNDGNGNENTCTASITVEGLPCGFSNTNGIGCNGDNDGTFDAVTETFSLTSDGCTSSFPHVEDNQSLISHELCGDGYVKALISNVSGNGFAGVAARNSLDVGAKKVELGTNNINKIIKTTRAIDNYPAYPQQQTSFDKFWVKIERTGNVFKASASVDDVNYFPYLFQAIQMENCLEVGLFVYSIGGEIVSAEFTNVEVVQTTLGLAADVSNILENDEETLLGIEVGTEVENEEWFEYEYDQEEIQRSDLKLNIYPNPTREGVTLNLSSVIGQDVEIRIYNTSGVLTYSQEIKRLEEGSFQLGAQLFDVGVYYITVISDDKQETLRLLKQ